MTKGELTVCGKTTLDAVRLLHDNHQLDYKETWTQAIVNHTSSDSTRKKGYPKNAFEDLCRCGYVKCCFSTNGQFSLCHVVTPVMMVMGEFYFQWGECLQDHHTQDIPLCF